MKKKELYTVPARCQVCSVKFKARYNIGRRARVCTLPDHICTPVVLPAMPGRRARTNPCTQNCCRSQYLVGAHAQAMDQAIDSEKLLTDEEFKRVLKASYSVSGDHGLVIRFIAGTGCRLGESLLVMREDASLDGDVPTVKIPTLKRKGRPRRTVDLHDEILVQELKARKKEKPRGPFFLVAKRTVQYHFSDILKKLKLRKSTGIHLLRHTRASQLSNVGAKPTYIRQQLGWASLEMAKVYTHIDIEERRGLIGKLPGYGGKKQ